MINRNRCAVVAGAAIGAAGIGAVRRARHRARARVAGEGSVDATLVAVAEDRPPASSPRQGDEAHAPGHRHLPVTEHDGERPPPAVGARPFAKHRRGLRHPGRG